MVHLIAPPKCCNQVPSAEKKGKKRKTQHLQKNGAKSQKPFLKTKVNEEGNLTEQTTEKSLCNEELNYRGRTPSARTHHFTGVGGFCQPLSHQGQPTYQLAIQVKVGCTDQVLKSGQTKLTQKLTRPIRFLRQLLLFPANVFDAPKTFNLEDHLCCSCVCCGCCSSSLSRKPNSLSTCF